MTNIVQMVRFTTTILAQQYIGPEGQLTVDEERWSLSIHDGNTPGGHELFRSDFSNIASPGNTFTAIITAIQALGTGFITKTSASTYAARSFVWAASDTHVAISNADGIAGNPTFTSSVELKASGRIIRSAKTADFNFAVTDRGNLIDVASATNIVGTLPLVTALSAPYEEGWFVYVRNSGTANVGVTVTSPDKIDGATTLLIPRKSVVILTAVKDMYGADLDGFAALTLAQSDTADTISYSAQYQVQASDPRYIKLNPAQPGLTVVLPDALGDFLGGTGWNFTNISKFQTAVRKNGPQKLIAAILNPNRSARCVLIEQLDAQGVWNVTTNQTQPVVFQRYGSGAGQQLTPGYTIKGAFTTVINTLGTVSVALSQATGGAYIQAFRHDVEPMTVSALTQVRSGTSVRIRGCKKIAENKVLVVTADNGTANVFARVAIIDPVTLAITFGTAVQLQTSSAEMLGNADADWDWIVEFTFGANYCFVDARGITPFTVDATTNTITVGTTNNGAAGGGADRYRIQVYIRSATQFVVGIMTDVPPNRTVYLYHVSINWTTRVATLDSTVDTGNLASSGAQECLWQVGPDKYYFWYLVTGSQSSRMATVAGTTISWAGSPSGGGNNGVPGYPYNWNGMASLKYVKYIQNISANSVVAPRLNESLAYWTDNGSQLVLSGSLVTLNASSPVLLTSYGTPDAAAYPMIVGYNDTNGRANFILIDLISGVITILNRDLPQRQLMNSASDHGQLIPLSPTSMLYGDTRGNFLIFRKEGFNWRIDDGGASVVGDCTFPVSPAPGRFILSGSSQQTATLSTFEYYEVLA